MNDSFDEMIQNEISRLPYEQLIDQSPYQQHVPYLIAGLLMILININAGFIGIIEPVIGWFLMLLAIKPLRKNSNSFMAAFYLCSFNFICHFIIAIVLSTVYSNSFTAFFQIMSVVLALSELSVLLLLSRGFNQLRETNGLDKMNTFNYLAAWYLILAVLASVNYQGLLIPLLMIALAIYLVMEVRKFVTQITQVSFAADLAGPKVSNKWLLVIMAMVLVSAIFTGHSLFNRYSMNWEKAVINEVPDNLTQYIDEDLLKLLDQEDLSRLSRFTRIIKTETVRTDNMGNTSTGYIIQVENENDEVMNVFYLYDLRWQNVSPQETTDAIMLYVTAANFAENSQLKIMPEKAKLFYLNNSHYYCCQPYPADTSSEKNFTGVNYALTQSYEFSLPKKMDEARGYLLLQVKTYHKDIDYSIYLNYIQGFNGGYPFTSGYQAYLNWNTDSYSINTLNTLDSWALQQ